MSPISGTPKGTLQSEGSIVLYVPHSGAVIMTMTLLFASKTPKDMEKKCEHASTATLCTHRPLKSRTFLQQCASANSYNKLLPGPQGEIQERDTIVGKWREKPYHLSQSRSCFFQSQGSAHVHGPPRPRL